VGGRYTLRSKPKAIAEAFDVPEVPLLETRYNIAPTQDAPVIRTSREGYGAAEDHPPKGTGARDRSDILAIHLVHDPVGER
jgi:putative SOS response-associated peptidase YedK